MIEIIGTVTFVALTLYVLFGGADYGAGILELFKNSALAKKQEEVVTRAIGPVWEANHIWLILVIVIFFNGFPLLYTTLLTHLHIPALALLVGIVTRGASFTMRHYDAFVHKPTRLYSLSFSLSSLWTSLWLGVIVGACVLGRINPVAQDFWTLYLYPWMNVFCLSLGLFVACAFTFLAASYLIGETTERELKAYFMRRALAANIAVVVSGAFVFIAAEYDGFSLFNFFVQSKLSVLSWVVATLLWIIQWTRRNTSTALFSRITAAGQVVCTLSGLFFAVQPTVIATTAGALTFANTAAPEATLTQLLIALLVGLCIILPSLALLLRVFKFQVEKAVK